LAVGCWPADSAQGGKPAVNAALALSVLAAAYLAYVGFSGGPVGLLLWPAVALHTVLAILLARVWAADRRAV
jgi:hypothetical protein